MKDHRKRYALVGTGGRAVFYVDGIVQQCRQHVALVGMCDLNRTRMNYYNQRIQTVLGQPPVPVYPAGDFDRMIAEQKPDGVIVCTVDAVHHQYIIRAMDLGCDVICEKPMTIDAPKARAIFDAIERTGRNLRVTFNLRYSPVISKIRELMAHGAVGRPLAVDFSWILDTCHGADYFRRWHREKDKSGGLLIHKGSHHFDAINWWVGSYPKTVFAMGDLLFYGRENARRRGETYSYDRYTGEERATQDPFALRLDEKVGLQGLYLDAEKEDGYIRDRNVFGDNITIEDAMAVTCRYRNGVILSYSLIAFSPWEGLRVSITGDKGRLEFFQKHSSHIIAGQTEKELAADQNADLVSELTVYPMFGAPQRIEVPKAEGAHGGGDPLLLDDLFSPQPPPDPLCRRASHFDGAASLLLGASANESIRTGQPVQCDELLKLPEQKP